MNSETYSSSLNSLYIQPDREAQETAFSEFTNDWSTEFNTGNLMANYFSMMAKRVQSLDRLIPLMGTFSDAMVFPTTVVSDAVAFPIKTVSNAANLPMAIVENLLTHPGVGLSSGPKELGGGVESVSPQVESHGWKQYINYEEYIARLGAITPKLANDEDEGYAPPAPQGKVRAVRSRLK
jgi:hypothetical protein